jgi:hypothetical protein
MMHDVLNIEENINDTTLKFISLFHFSAYFHNTLLFLYIQNT